MRRRINKDLVADLQFRADLRCCLCPHDGGLPRRIIGGQVHHLDANPGNNDPANLVWLCLEHHEEAEKRGAATRRLSPETIIIFRTSLEQRVRALRDTPSRAKEGSNGFKDALDAAVAFDVHLLRTEHPFRWDTAQAELARISLYPEDMGYHARRAVLYHLEGMASRTRLKMPEDIAYGVSQVTMSLLPLYFFRKPRKTTVRDAELLSIGVDVGESLAYDGALYLNSLKILDHGCQILWRVMTYSVVYRHRGLGQRVARGFELALDGATRSSVPLAHDLVNLYRRHGERGGTRFPDYPPSIADAL